MEYNTKQVIISWDGSMLHVQLPTKLHICEYMVVIVFVRDNRAAVALFGIIMAIFVWSAAALQGIYIGGSI